MRSLKRIFINLFLCKCLENHGIINLRGLKNNRVVGRCLKCNKRVYGKTLLGIPFLARGVLGEEII